MPLTAIAIQNAKPKATQYLLTDGTLLAKPRMS